MTWVEIVMDYLEKNNCIGLKNTTQECYCETGEILDCVFHATTFLCVPAKNEKEIEGYSKGYEV